MSGGKGKTKKRPRCTSVRVRAMIVGGGMEGEMTAADVKYVNVTVEYELPSGPDKEYEIKVLKLRNQHDEQPPKEVAILGEFEVMAVAERPFFSKNVKEKELMHQLIDFNKDKKSGEVNKRVDAGTSPHTEETDYFANASYSFAFQRIV